LSVRSILKSMTSLPWAYVILFDIAALTALVLAILLQTTRPIPAEPKISSDASDLMAKRIAFSFDDVPRGPGAFLEQDRRPAMLIKALQDGGVSGAAFFANPGRISGINKGAEAIAAYAAAGHVIGNHTQNHLPLSPVPVATFLQGVKDAEIWLKPQHNYRPWFRFPRLDEGRKDMTKRDAARAGLKALGIRNAYVTADGWDWFMESRTIASKRAGKAMDMAALRNLYIETHVESANFSDRLALRMLGRRPVQMLLLHETDLAAMYVDDLAAALRADGWQIVAADVAYADPIAKMTPNPEFADGTLLEMLAWEKGITGNRWFPRNNIPVARKLFASRVLHE
jgi:peptidoglycan/xylan/chitin deacetylase (PgdA/CDA1 family)